MGGLILECNLKEIGFTLVCKNYVSLKKSILTTLCKISHSEMQKDISKQIIYGIILTFKVLIIVYIINNRRKRASNTQKTYTITDQSDFVALKNCKLYTTYMIKIFLNITKLLIMFVQTGRHC